MTPDEYNRIIARFPYKLVWVIDVNNVDFWNWAALLIEEGRCFVSATSIHFTHKDDMLVFMLKFNYVKNGTRNR